jgi:hypothetical protein
MCSGSFRPPPSGGFAERWSSVKTCCNTRSTSHAPFGFCRINAAHTCSGEKLSGAAVVANASIGPLNQSLPTAFGKMLAICSSARSRSPFNSRNMAIAIKPRS